MNDATSPENRATQTEVQHQDLGHRIRPNYVGMGFLVILALLGIAYLVTSLSYGWSAETNPMGPGAAPAVLGGMLVLGCLILLGQEIRSHRRAIASADQGLSSAETAAPGGTDLAKPLLILLLVVIGLLLTPVLSMLIAMPLVVVAVALIVEKLKPVPALVMGAVTALMLWLIFQELLSIRFPSNLIGI